MTENAKEMVTARGRPSGTAITITFTDVINASKKMARAYLKSQGFATSGQKMLVRMIFPHPTARVMDAAMTPILARELAIFSSFC
jgi:hypothetical protein